jgi:hypothetical protein
LILPIGWVKVISVRLRRDRDAVFNEQPPKNGILLVKEVAVGAHQPHSRSTAHVVMPRITLNRFAAEFLPPEPPAFADDPSMKHYCSEGVFVLLNNGPGNSLLLALFPEFGTSLTD